MVPFDMELNNRAANLSDLGDHKSAVACLNKALLGSTSTSGGSTLTNDSPYNSGDKAKNKNLRFKFEGGYDEGMRTFSQNVTFTTEDRNELSMQHQIVEATIFYNLGIIHTRLKDDEEALNYFTKAEFLKKYCEASTIDIVSPDEASRSQSEPEPSVVAILHNVAHIHFRAGRYADAEKKYRAALHNAQQLRDYYHSEVAASLNCICVVALYTSKDPGDCSEPIRLLSEAVEIYKYLGDELCSATANNNLGRLKIAVGDLKGALFHFNDALQIRRHHLSSTDLDVAATIFNIGETLHLQEKIDEALESYLQFLSIASTHFGEYHSDIVCTLKIIAECYHDTNNHESALAFYLKALKSARRVNSPTHAEIAVILNKIGNIHYEIGNLEEALRTYEDGLEVERKLYKENDPNILVTLLNIARVFHNENKAERALEIYEEGLTIQRKCGDEEKMNMAGTLSSIGLIYDQLGFFAEAIESFEEALDIRQNFLGSDHFDVSSTLNSLGLVFFHKGLYNQALEKFKDSLRIRQISITATHRDVATVLYNIATVHLEMGCTDESLKYYNDCLKIERSRKSKSGVISSLKRIGQIYEKQNEFGLALQKYQEAVDTCLDVSLDNANHVEIAHIFGLIGHIYLANGNIALASKTFARAISANRIAGLEDLANLNVDMNILVALTRKCSR
jgi:tetratricopeptide (TPR) repeat protein